MSPFQRWCHQAQTTLNAAGLKLRYGRVQQLLAGALGHDSLFSLQSTDAPSFTGAGYALLDEQRMLGRARALRVNLTPDLANAVCLALRDESAAPTLIRERYFGVVVQRSFPDSGDPRLEPLQAQVAESVPGHTIEHPQALWAEQLNAFEECRSWWWDVRGTVLALKNGDGYELPFTARLEFVSVGRRLLAKPIIQEIRQSGPPEPWDSGITDYAYLSDSDS